MRYVLFVSAGSVTSYAHGRSGFDAPVIFHNNEDSRQQLCQYLLERIESVFSVVLDSQDEEHHTEIIPALRGRDKTRAVEQVVQRAAVSGSMYSCSVSHQSNTATSAESTGKAAIKKLRVTICHVGARTDCAHWLQLLDEHSVLVDSISSFSLLAQQVLQKFQVNASLCLLRLHQNEYRVLGFRSGSPVINRHLTSSELSAESLITELDKTRDYLTQLDDRNTVAGLSGTENTSNREKVVEPALLIGLVPSDVKQALEIAGVQVISENRLYKHLKHKNPTASFAIEMMVGLMAERKVRATTSYRGDYRIHLKQRKTRHSLLAGAVCCAALSAFAATAAVKIDNGYSTLQTIVESRRDALRTIVEQESGVVAVDSEKVNALRQSIALARQIEAGMQFTPLHFLSPFAAELSLYPEVAITGVHWTAPVPAGLSIATVNANAEPGADADFGSYDASVTGYLTFADGEITEAVRQFNSFVGRLQRSNRYQSVDIIEAPFGISDQATTTSQSGHAGKADFQIVLHVSGLRYE